MPTQVNRISDAEETILVFDRKAWLSSPFAQKEKIFQPPLCYSVGFKCNLESCVFLFSMGFIWTYCYCCIDWSSCIPAFQL